MIATARRLHAESRREWPSADAEQQLVTFGRDVRCASVSAMPFPVEGLSASVAADAFLAMARALVEARLPTRRSAFADALAAIAEALEILLDERPLAAAEVWRRRFGQDD